MSLHLTGLLLLVAVCPGLAQAAEPSIEIHLQPTTFGVDDLAQLSVRVNEPPAGLGPPTLDGLDNLEVVQGPSTGSEFSYVNGVATRAQTFTYVVRAPATGPLSTGPVIVRAGDVELRAEPVTGEAVEGSVMPPRGRTRRSPFTLDPFADLRPRRAPRIELVLRHSLSATEAALGQPLVATVYLDSTVSSLYDFDWRTAPSYPGFWAQRLDNPEQVTPEIVEIDGTRFFRYEVLRSVLVPLKTGAIEIPAVEAAIGVRTMGFFDSGELLERSSPSRTVTVAGRPPGPPGFAGAVGDLRYTAAVEPAEIEHGSSAVLTITLDGRGNLPLVEAPAVWPTCDGCDTYPPEESSDVTIDAAGIRGSRSWQMTVVPQRWGELTLEPVELAVYDPAAGRYRVQTIGPLSLTVAAPPATPTPAPSPTPVGGSVEAPPAGRAAGAGGAPPWVWIGGALALGAALGGGAVWFSARRSRHPLPPRRAEQSPAERARELQHVLEGWWLSARSSARRAELEDEMLALRRELENVRFAPGRADHSQTVLDLEARLQRLLRRA